MRTSAMIAIAVVYLSAASRAAPTRGGDGTHSKGNRIVLGHARVSDGAQTVLPSSSSSSSSGLAGASSRWLSMAPCNCTAVPALTLGLRQNFSPTSSSLMFVLNGSSIVAIQNSSVQVSQI